MSTTLLHFLNGKNDFLTKIPVYIQVYPICDPFTPTEKPAVPNIELYIRDKKQELIKHCYTETHPLVD